MSARRRFAVLVRDADPPVHAIAEGETFFEARAALAVELHVDPLIIRVRTELDVPVCAWCGSHDHSEATCSDKRRRQR